VIKAIIIFAVILLGAVPSGRVFAIADPTSITIEDVRGYDGVLADSDLLLVVEYNIVYASTPTETINEAFLGRFKRAGTEYASTEPYAYNDKGYGRGVFSLYWTKEQKETDSIEFSNPNNESYTLILQGKPGVFPGSPPSTTTGTIDWRDSANTAGELFTHIRYLANRFQNDAGWAENIPLISTSAGIVQLSAKGEDYFTNAVSRLSQMVPTIFSSGVSSPDASTAEHSRSFEAENKEFWATDGAWVDTRFQNLADTFRVPKTAITSLLAFFIVAGVAWGMAKLMGESDRGWEFGLLTVALTLPLVTAVNWMPMAVTMSVALFAVLGIAWTLFLRRAGN
jgi:hypothetical protein